MIYRALDSLISVSNGDIWYQPRQPSLWLTNVTENVRGRIGGRDLSIFPSSFHFASRFSHGARHQWQLHALYHERHQRWCLDVPRT